MLGGIFEALIAVYGSGALYGYLMRGLDGSPYPSPEWAEREMEEITRRFPSVCVSERIGQSTEGRPINAFRFRAVDAGETRQRPRLLVTAHIHAVEFIGAYVARALARRLAEGYRQTPHIAALLDRADVWVVPLLNPDGAARVWRRGGWSRLGASRFTATGVDPNRNFPFVPLPGAAGWNSASTRPGSPYYRGPHPLSEPECLALARLCARERFCAALNFHSFGGVVFMPQVRGPQAERVNEALAVFRGVFQSYQRHLPYRPVPERSAKILGQLDPFLLNAFGTPSVTIEVSRPGRHLLRPTNLCNVFWWANPGDPQRWVENDADAAIHALVTLLERTGGTTCVPAYPELAESIGAVGGADSSSVSQ